MNHLIRSLSPLHCAIKNAWPARYIYSLVAIICALFASISTPVYPQSGLPIQTGRLLAKEDNRISPYTPGDTGTSIPGSGFAKPLAMIVGYEDFVYGSDVTEPTGEKPESKLWWNNGYWWGCLWNQSAERYHIYWYEPVNLMWHDTGIEVDNRPNTRVDVLWDGNLDSLYIASHVFNEDGSGPSRLYRYKYSAGNPGTYAQDSDNPVQINGDEVEALVIEKDSFGKLWAVWERSDRVNVATSSTNGTTWSSPFTPANIDGITNLKGDDICSIISFGGNKIGLMWSNQNDETIYFAVHPDGAPDEDDWSGEVAIDSAGEAVADDHINLGTDNDGNVYAVTKTSLSSSSDPKIYVAKRNTSGVWSRTVFGKDSDDHTRPILVVDSDNNQLYVFATTGAIGGDDAIVYKVSDLANMAFSPGVGTNFIQSSVEDVNNPSSTKQRIGAASNLLVIASTNNASSSGRYYHNYLQIEDNSLPVELTAFLVEWVKDAVELSWVTESEINNLGFKIVRVDTTRNESLIIASYENNAELLGQGDSSTRNYYTFTDHQIEAGRTYRYILADVDYNGRETYHSPVEITIPTEETLISTSFTLHPNFPNPFNSGTIISFEITSAPVGALNAQLFIYNSLGQLVQILFEGKFGIGSYQMKWNGVNQDGNPAPAGFYFAVLKVEQASESIKMILVK